MTKFTTIKTSNFYEDLVMKKAKEMFAKGISEESFKGGALMIYINNQPLNVINVFEGIDELEGMKIYLGTNG